MMTNTRVKAASRSELQDLYYHGDTKEIAEKARAVTEAVHGKQVLLRGLVEFSNHCSMNCLYCGIRSANKKVRRYRLYMESIFSIIKTGFKAGLRTFVLQSGEDNWFTQEYLCGVVRGIKKITNNEAAVTLSCGIKSRKEYQQLFEAGADRYLLRFETADPRLHKYIRNGSTLEERLRALENLRAAGFQLGSGFMVGLPGEEAETGLENILLAQKLNLDMAGIGPFIPHQNTPLAGSGQSPIEKTVRMTALLRLALPYAHLPATTAAGSVHPEGREMMIQGGANVLMPNITPPEAKSSYLLYPGKICLDESGVQCIGCLSTRMKPLDRKLDFSIGHSLHTA